jgi:lipopolysaccharide/colanic/teichoic acid biosynthesis glycosyltransferase
MKRVVDIVGATLGLITTAPVLIAATLGIRLSSAGPVLYTSPRIGRDGRPFTILKLRTMHANTCGTGSAITAHRDPRVFPFGAWLRVTKIDELPQLLNVLRGDMSIVGPRPEDPRIVCDHYGPLGAETLTVRPGLTSPGSLYGCTDGARLVSATDPEGSYLRDVLPRKLALDVAYVRTVSLGTDLALIVRTIWVIATPSPGGRWSRGRQAAAATAGEREPVDIGGRL